MSEQKVTNCGTFFSDIEPFPAIEQSKIDTAHFLKASTEMVKLIDILGKIFAPVRYDVHNNIEKLCMVYNKDKQKYKYIQDMILDKQNGSTEALQWLRRALHFISSFLDNIIRDHNKKKSDEITKYLRNAYIESLLPYHSWMTQQLFSLICRMCPSKDRLFEILTKGDEVDSELIIREMKTYNEQLAFCVKELKSFYVDNQLETVEVV